MPVTIDGTEQALTVWRGYNGASNRNYIDPFLIGGVRILKGPSLTRNVTPGIGGAMVIDTLDVDDILDTGQRFGGEFRAEGSSNAVAPRLPTLHTGEDYRTVEGFPQATPNIPYTDRTLRVTPRAGGGGYDMLDGEDHAYRLALGARPREDLDLLAAYAYRERGNYYSGTHGAGYYRRRAAPPPTTTSCRWRTTGGRATRSPTPPAGWNLGCSRPAGDPGTTRRCSWATATASRTTAK